MIYQAFQISLYIEYIDVIMHNVHHTGIGNMILLTWVLLTMIMQQCKNLSILYKNNIMHLSYKYRIAEQVKCIIYHIITVQPRNYYKMSYNQHHFIHLILLIQPINQQIYLYPYCYNSINNNVSFFLVFSYNMLYIV